MLMVFFLTIFISILTVDFFLFLTNQEFKVFFLLVKFSINFICYLTLPFYCLIDKPWKRTLKTYSTVERRFGKQDDVEYVEFKTVKKNFIGKPHYEQLIKKFDDLTNLGNVMKIVTSLYGNKEVFGKRQILDCVHLPNKKYNKLKLAPKYTFITYQQADEEIDNLAKFLATNLNLKKNDKVAILLETRPEWFFIANAVHRLGCILVTLHATFNDKAIFNIFELTGVKLVFTQKNLLNKFLNNQDKYNYLENIIYLQNPSHDKNHQYNNNECKFELFEYLNLIEQGSKLRPLAKLPEVSFDHLAFIMYTSGSTGFPKGVLIPHGSLIQNIKNILKNLHYKIDIDFTDKVFCFLPLSHIFELIIEYTFFLCGCQLIYGNPITFLKGSPGLVKGCNGDLDVGKPTVLIGVPLILKNLQSNIQSELKSKFRFLPEIYELIYNYVLKWSEKGYSCALTKKIFFYNRFLPQTKLIICGGAPLQLQMQKFVKIYLNNKLMNAYSSTECLGLGAYSFLDQYDHRNSIELCDEAIFRLVDWKEGGYSVKDKPNPRGEILIGGTISSGYYKNEAENEQAFYEQDGVRFWVSGDIGEIDENGLLSIIDRKKDLVKLQMGEYIAIGKVEAVLKNFIYLNNVCVHGNSNYNHLVALIEPNHARLIELAARLNKSDLSIEQLCNDKELTKLFLDELDQYARKTNCLLTKEIPVLIKLCPESWNISNDLLTISLKVKRKSIYDFYAKDIQLLYDELQIKFKN